MMRDQFSRQQNRVFPQPVLQRVNTCLKDNNINSNVDSRLIAKPFLAISVYIVSFLIIISEIVTGISLLLVLLMRLSSHQHKSYFQYFQHLYTLLLNGISTVLWMLRKYFGKFFEYGKKYFNKQKTFCKELIGNIAHKAYYGLWIAIKVLPLRLRKSSIGTAFLIMHPHLLERPSMIIYARFASLPGKTHFNQLKPIFSFFNQQ